jgi:hypothetical protein
MELNQSASSLANHFRPMHDFSILWQTAVAFLLTVFILIAVTGNILVCIAIYTDRNLRHIGNTFTASLALADLLVGLVGKKLKKIQNFDSFITLPINQSINRS